MPQAKAMWRASCRRHHGRLSGAFYRTARRLYLGVRRRDRLPPAFERRHDLLSKRVACAEKPRPIQGNGFMQRPARPRRRPSSGIAGGGLIVGRRVFRPAIRPSPSDAARHELKPRFATAIWRRGQRSTCIGLPSRQMRLRLYIRVFIDGQPLRRSRH